MMETASTPLGRDRTERPGRAAFRLDGAAYIRHWGPEAHRSYGFSASQVCGRHLSYLAKETVRDGARIPDLLVSAAASGSARGVLDQRRADGTTFPVVLTLCALRGAPGAGLAFLVQSEPVGADRAAAGDDEVGPGVVLAAAADAIFTLDEQRRILQYNRTAEQLFRRPAAQVLGRLIDGLLPGLAQVLAGARAGRPEEGAEGQPLHRELVGRRGDATEFPAEVALTEVRAGGRHLLTLVVHDLTERRLQDERWRRSIRELEVAVCNRDSVLSVAAHELKTPLTALHLQAQRIQRALRGGSAPAPGLAGAAGMVQSIDRMGRLIDDLLDAARLSSGRLDLRPSEVDLGELAREIAERLADQLAAAECELTIQESGSLAGRWDGPRLDQVLTNLLTNAIKYGAGHPIELSLSGDQELVRVLVTDHGVGVPDGEQQRIFERFERAEGSERIGGFGLGLWIAKQIVDQHQGCLRMWSKPGLGSTFLVELPRARGPRGEPLAS